MVSAYIAPDVSPALRLKHLLGEKWKGLQPNEHPLGLARRALDIYMTGKHPLSVDEKVALAHLKRWAQTIDRTERHWLSHRAVFIKDLLTASRCRSLLFEAEVITACIHPNVRAYEWPIYRAGERDIQTTSPDMLVECKYTNVAELGRALKRTSKARAQARPRDVPFVVAVGFDQVLTPQQVSALEQRASQNREWFVARPDLSAVLIMMETSEPIHGIEWNPLGFKGTTAFVAGLLEIRNDASTNPLPLTFSFGGIDGVQRMRANRRPVVVGHQ